MANLPTDWFRILGHYISINKLSEVLGAIEALRMQGNVIYPADADLFKAFELTPLNSVKVVLLGQDPYHGKGQAHGLSFSVPYGIALPPSLKNIYKELHADLGIIPAGHGNLSHWARQGVLLLNASLSVEEGKPGSHVALGWNAITDAVIKAVSTEKSNVVFILWGNFAKSKSTLIDADKHLVLTAAHPSPLGAHKGFWGSKPFSQCNDYLNSNGIVGIDWALPPYQQSELLFNI